MLMESVKNFIDVNRLNLSFIIHEIPGEFPFHHKIQYHTTHYLYHLVNRLQPKVHRNFLVQN